MLRPITEKVHSGNGPVSLVLRTEMVLTIFVPFKKTISLDVRNTDATQIFRKTWHLTIVNYTTTNRNLERGDQWI